MINWIDPKITPPTIKGCYFILFENDYKGTGITLVKFTPRMQYKKEFRPEEDIFIGICGPSRSNLNGALVGDSNDTRYDKFIAYKERTSQGIPVKEVLFYSPVSEINLPTDSKDKKYSPIPPLIEDIYLQKIDIKELEESIARLEQDLKSYTNLAKHQNEKMLSMQSQINGSLGDIKNFKSDVKSDITEIKRLHSGEFGQSKLEQMSNNITATMQRHDNNIIKFGQFALHDIKKLDQRLEKIESLFKTQKDIENFLDLFQKYKGN